jgi:hypothetical protein
MVEDGEVGGGDGSDHAATSNLNAIDSAVIGHDSRGLPHPATAAPSPQGATILVFTDHGTGSARG